MVNKTNLIELQNQFANIAETVEHQRGNYSQSVSLIVTRPHIQSNFWPTLCISNYQYNNVCFKTNITKISIFQIPILEFSQTSGFHKTPMYSRKLISGINFLETSNRPFCNSFSIKNSIFPCDQFSNFSIFRNRNS